MSRSMQLHHISVTACHIRSSIYEIFHIYLHLLKECLIIDERGILAYLLFNDQLLHIS